MHLTALSFLIAHAAALGYVVPTAPPSNASQQLIQAPIGVSIEFFAFPGYTKLAATTPCLKNLARLGGKPPILRIGGTTQDRATYNASSPDPVTYNVSSPADAPASLTFGPSFFSLANKFKTSTVIGLNRQLNNLLNTINAAKKAVALVKGLQAVELGNEPDFYASNSPINTYGNDWSPADDYASQHSWQASVAGNLSTTNIISAGVYFGAGDWSIQGLTGVERSSSKYVNNYCSHNYPQSQYNANLPQLMSHSAISQNIAQFQGEIAAAHAKGKPHVMGETNSATGGGGGISPMFGSGLWIMDYSLQLLWMGTRNLNFHQGTIGNCPYCWWDTTYVQSPYYGAYFASLALAGADQIAPLDTFDSNYGVWAIYSQGNITKVLLYNSDAYYSGSTRPTQTFSLNGLQSSKVYTTLMTAPDVTAQQSQGNNPTIGGQSIQNGTCQIQGAPAKTPVRVKSGTVSFSVGASEALLIYL